MAKLLVPEVVLAAAMRAGRLRRRRSTARTAVGNDAALLARQAARPVLAAIDRSGLATRLACPRRHGPHRCKGRTFEACLAVDDNHIAEAVVNQNGLSQKGYVFLFNRLCSRASGPETVYF